MTIENRSATIVDLIRKSAEPVKGAEQEGLCTISVRRTRELSYQSDLSCREVELEALKQNIIPLRYLRNRTTYSAEDQIRFLEARVAIVGLGGLGGTVVEIMARAGVGKLALIDGDRFEDHNLNRQLVSTEKNTGVSKATAARERLASINAAVEANVHPIFLSSDNAVELIQDCDVVVDCLDNITSRFVLEAAARQVGRPFVSAAVAGLTGHVTVIFPQDRGLELVYGPPEGAREAKGAEIVLGCPPQTVALVAAKQCAEILNLLSNRTGQLLRDKLWVVDLYDHTTEVLSLAG